MVFLTYLFILIFFLTSLAFLTLLERKFLGIIQFRLGPNKTFVGGVFQPFSDAIKLFISNKFLLFKSFNTIFILAPSMMLLILLFNFSLVPISEYLINMNYSILILMVFFSFSVYFFMGGYFSGSKYSFLGSWRCLVQMMSYEIMLFFLFIFLFYYKKSFSIYFSSLYLDSFVLIFIFPFWLIILLVESGRIPFDLMEGESELVSGFNTEYWSGSFSFIFIYEYGMVIFVSLLSSVFFFSGLMIYLSFILMLLFFIFVRGMVPRIRYDILLYFTWLVLFPLVLSFLIFFVL